MVLLLPATLFSQPAWSWAEGAGAGSDQRGYAIAADINGNSFTTGYIKGSNNSFGSNQVSAVGGDDAFLAKYDVNGNNIWVTRIGGAGDDYGYGVAIDASGNSYVCGKFQGTLTLIGLPNINLFSSGNNDIFIAKYDPSGNVVWAKNAGSANNDEASAVITNGTNVFITGIFSSTATFGALPSLVSTGGDDVFVAAYNCSTGAETWAVKGGSTANDHGDGIAVDASGVYVGGHYDGTCTFQNHSGSLTNNGNSDIFLVKYDLTGTTGLWKRRAGGSGGDEGTCVTLNGNNVYVGGFFSNTMSIYDTGPAVATITADNNDDGFIIQYNATSGNYNWVRSENGDNEDRIYDISASPQGNVYTTGFWTGDLPFGSGPSVNASGEDIFVTCYSAAGTFMFGMRATGSDDERGRGISAGNNYSAHVTGYFKSSTANFGSNPVSVSGNEDIFISMVGCTVTTSNAGSNQTLCSTTATLNGNTPVFGTGMWTLISGSGTIVSPTVPNSSVTGLGVGANVFRWSLTNGPCGPNTDDVTITRDANPSTSNAGPDQTMCSSSATLAGNVPGVGTGLWTLVSGVATITTPSSATSGVTGMTVGTRTLQWTITNGVCPSSSDQVIIIRDPTPTTANAGPDQTICSSSSTLAGNTPTIGSGVWTLISGTGSITTPSSPTSGVTGLSVGVNIFEWTISNGTCPSSSDQVPITVDPNPTVSNAGPDQTLCTSTATLAGNVPTIGTGMWTLISGSATITTSTSASSGITALGVGTNVFRWTISNGTCPSSFDEVTIIRDPNPTNSNAGPNQTICSSSSSLAGNAPTIGSGVWTLISGTGTVTTPTSPTSGVTGLSVGVNVFQWTISNGTCPSSSDQVTITRDALPTTANAGSNQTLCSSTAFLNANSPVIGTGLWTLVSGTGTIVTPTNDNTTVNSLSVGNNVFQWTISNGTCPSSTDQVTITVDPFPTTSNAGPNQTLCSSSATLGGNIPVTGTGMWTLISGTGNISTPTSANSNVTSLGVGNNVFQWTISNGTCPSSTDQVTITRDAVPTTSNAGSNQTLCASSAFLNANSPAIGTGLWTLVSGTGTIVSPTNDNTTVNSLSVGNNVFQWTITNGTCPSSTDQVTITVDPLPTTSNAGPNQTLCSSSATLGGNIPVTGTGMWTLISGTGTISTPTSANSNVTSLGIGSNVFQWTISNGTCPSSTDQVTITRDAVPTTSNAGSNQTLCASSAFLNANSPAIGTGLWTLVSGTGTIVSPTNDNTTVNSLSVGNNVFQWTITNGTCPSSTDQVTITVDPLPTTSNAGPNQTLCSSSATLGGNIPVTGTGMWTLISGTGTISTPTSANSNVTSLGIGNNVFQWTISNGTCPSSSDQVTITRDQMPSTAFAGSNQTLCSSTAFLNAVNPSTGTGLWTLVSGSGTIVTPTNDNTTVNSLGIGPNVFQWTVSNGTCPSSTDQVTITVDAVPTTSAAGTDQTICSSTATLSGNIPVVGTGVWTLISGAGNISNSTSANSAVTSLGIGNNVFEWKISNGTCPSSTDQVTITRDALPNTANAGSDQTLCSSTVFLNANNVVTGTGLWTLISGSGIISTPTNDNTFVNSVLPGTNVFQWTISNGVCPPSTDQVTITVDSLPTIADAGLDQTICSSSATMNGNVPVTGNGLWTLISGTGTISNPSSATSGITSLTVGTNVFEWTISNGTCPSSTDQVTITVDPMPSTASAGADQTLCTSSALLNSNNPSIGTGLWTLVSGNGTIVTPNNDNTAVNSLGVGANVFQWTISNGVCPSSTDQVTITVDDFPTVADAGSDQTFCSSTQQLSGNTPLVGSGMWTVIAGTGVITNSTLPNSNVTSLPVGVNIFQWTISNGVCPPSSDLVTFNVDPQPTLPSAGIDHSICSLDDTLNANVAVIGSGVWTLVSGSGVIGNPASPSSPVSLLGVGVNEFVWTISNGTCPSVSDTVAITRDDFPSIASAGTDANSCSPDDSLFGNIPAVGSGTWSVITGSGVIVNPASQLAVVNNLSVGANEFVWTISNGVCRSQHDTVIITYNQSPSPAVAGTDIFACEEQITMQAQVPLVGSGIWVPINGSPPIIDSTNPQGAVPLLPAGTWNYVWTTQNGFCISVPDTIAITVYAPPDSAICGNDLMVYNPDVTLSATPITTGTGTWTFVQGSGNIEDIHDPFTRVSDLSVGVNIMRWTTSNGVCEVSSDDMRIEVLPLIIPEGFSPNGDGVNDQFEITGLNEFENGTLEVFNRWGNVVYTSVQYRNDWTGNGESGIVLPDDVYYYVLKADTELVFTGFIVIKRNVQ